MTLPPLPKLFHAAGLGEVGRRVYDWVSAAQLLLAALRTRSNELDTRVTDLEEAEAGAGVTDHGALTGLSDDDHTQYLKTDGTRALTGDQSAGGNKITNLAASTSNGDAVRHEDARLSDDRTASGLRTASTVVAVSAATAPTAGQILQATAGNAAQWASAPGLGSVWSADIPPTSPEAENDEFTAGSLDAKWSEFDPGTLLTVGMDTSRKMVTLTGSGNNSVRLAGIYQPIPDTEFAAYSKVHMISRLERGGIGLFVGGSDVVNNPTTADLQTAFFRYTGLTALLECWDELFTAYTTESTNTSVAAYGAAMSGYLRVRLNGTTWSGDFSPDGISWAQVSADRTLGFTPAYVGLFLYTFENAISFQGMAKFFRVFSGAGTSGADATKIGGFL